MTRLDATSEPSMEDILASIRKIIAEDPPGSRPALTPSTVASTPAQNAALQPTLRAPDREPFAPFARNNDEAAAPSSAPAPEPYLKTSPQKPTASDDYNKEPFFAPRSSALPSAPVDPAIASSSRIEPSFGPMSSVSTPLAASADEIGSGAAGVTVDAQLSDLLGETASVVIATGTAPSTPQFGDRMAGRSVQAADPSVADIPLTSAAASSTTSEARPGFTVSRDGFVAPANEVSPEPAPTVESDPFEFDLGPSPFLAKTEETAAAPASTPAPAPMGNSLTARMSASSLERIAAPAAVATVVTESAHEAKGNTATGSENATVDTTPTAGVTPAEVAAPSVAATLAPNSFSATPAFEPIGRFIPANAGVEAPKPIDRDVLEVVAPSADTATIEVVRAEPEADRQPQLPPHSPSTAVAVHHGDGQMRTMEETVAELLRPMLKSWLAENMPRIVERALRRELNEQMMLDKKDAAE